MKKIIFVGRSGCGKTTLTQALNGQTIAYHKTQYINYGASIIDTPGEYAETKNLGYALALYAYEADIVGLLLSAIEPFSLYSPNIAPMANREVIGIVTQIDHPHANILQAKEWLGLAGCKLVLTVSSVTGAGIRDLCDYLGKTTDPDVG